MALNLVAAALAKKLAAEGLGLIGNAVLAKGRDVVEQTLGVDLEKAVSTEDGRARLLDLQIQKERQLHQFIIEQRELEVREYELSLKDVADSRATNVQIQESANASWLAKNSGYVLDFTIVLSTIALITLLLLKAVPEANQNIAFSLLGSLITMCITVVQWHRGSSQGSARKQDEIKQLAMKEK